MLLIVEYPLRGTISLPLNAFIYVRKKEIKKLKKVRDQQGENEIDHRAGEVDPVANYGV